MMSVFAELILGGTVERAERLTNNRELFRIGNPFATDEAIGCFRSHPEFIDLCINVSCRCDMTIERDT